MFSVIAEARTPIPLRSFGAFVVGLVSLLPRLPKGGSWGGGRFLWAEDGIVFFQQAADLGAKAFWTSYAGYLHTYPRIFAWLASFLDLQYLPTMFLVGWFIAYACMIAAIVFQGSAAGLRTWDICILVALCSLQPSVGETFLNITNAQWLLGAALALWLLAQEAPPRWSWPVILLACFTGPFAVIFLPLVVLNALRQRKPWRTVILTIVGLATLVTGWFAAHSQRMSGPWDRSWRNWADAIGGLLSFSADESLVKVGVLFFWGSVFLVLAACRWTLLRQYIRVPRRRELITAALLFATGGAVLIASLLSTAKDPRAIVFIRCGSRYAWVPYCLFFVAAAILTTRAAVLRYTAFAAIALICAKEMHRVPVSDELQYASFVAFSRYQDELTIPINPVWPTHPGWSMHAKGAGGLLPSERLQVMASDDFNAHDLQVKKVPGDFQVMGGEPNLETRQRIHCADSGHVAVEVDMQRDREGWVSLAWRSGDNYVPGQELRRFYPAGQITAQFAFPNAAAGFDMRLNPAGAGSGEIHLSNVRVACLPPSAQPAIGQKLATLQHLIRKII